MSRFRSYWIYSLGLAVVWGVILVIGCLVQPSAVARMLPVFGGFCVGWVSTTIARYVYPPAGRWSGPTDAQTYGRPR